MRKNIRTFVLLLGIMFGIFFPTVLANGDMGSHLLDDKATIDVSQIIDVRGEK